MDNGQKLNRRNFLRIAGVTAATATIAACGGPQGTQPAGEGGQAEPTAPAAGEATTVPPTTAPNATAEVVQVSQFNEAPMLAERVAAGELPPVDERLPANPLVIRHDWLTTGQYGGRMQWSANGTWGISGFVHESMYGHSPLRWLKDGLEIGPGLVEAWESNDDASEWTLKFREGLKWSDGEPWTVDDIMFWWEDMVLNEDHPAGPPDEARSGLGTLAEFRKVDDYTLQMVFDAPAPLTADRLAMWVNGNGGNPIGPAWMVPRHYVEQFHPKYNDAYSDYEEFDQKSQFRINPECPTMTGWMLESYEEGVRGVWTRNPYYWCVDQEGNQLPYIDGIVMTGVQDAEVEKLGFLEGRVDFAWFHSLTLADVRALRDAQSSSGLEVRFWDSGSGTGSIFFLNYDYKDDAVREIIRNPQFRKAISHAYNRTEVQKVVYFNTGELTTGTMSPKAIEYNFNEEAQQRYAEWRDSAIAYDPEMANSMLDELGMVDSNGDGFRELPDGSEFILTLDYPADTGDEHINKNNLLARDLQAVGINARPNPITPTGYDDQWRAGEILTKTAWEVGDGPNHLVYPQWVVPIEFARWAPLHGTHYDTIGTPDETAEQDVNPWERQPPRIKPSDTEYIDESILRLWELYDQSRVEPDALRRHQLVWDMMRIHVENGPFFMGVVANYPRIALVKEGLMNVPQQEDLALGGFGNPWIHPTPAVYDPESWFFEDPSAHP